MNNALKKAKGLIGNSKLADELGISAAAVSKWVEAPAERVIPIAVATKWKVTPHELRPDLYPNPHDGLPEHLRSAA